MGGVPLMLGTGTGSQIRQPLGYAIVGGLLISQLLTLFTTPVVYIYMDRLTPGLEANRRREALRVRRSRRCHRRQAKPDAPGGRKVGQMVV